MLTIVPKTFIWQPWKYVQIKPVFKVHQFDEIVTEPVESPSNSPPTSPVFLLILVNSNSNDKERIKNRNAIRRIWKDCDIVNTNNRTSCMLVFYMARSKNDALVQEECRQYGDILLVDYHDTYTNITRKVLVALKWSVPWNPKFVLKMDDDIVVHSSRFMKELVAMKETKNFYGGNVWSGSVARDPKHRHYVSRDLYAHAYFPPFCKGACYVFSGDLLQPLIRAVNYVPTFGVDDAYIGLLMKYLRVSPVQLSSIVLLPHKVLTPLLNIVPTCALTNVVALGDNLDSVLMLNLYQKFQIAEEECLFFRVFPFSVVFGLGVMSLVVFLLYFVRHKIFRHGKLV